MTYQPGIPIASDFLATSQGDLLTNFTQLNTQFGVDHTPFNTGSGNGDGTHLQVTINDPLVSDPSPIGDGGVYYTKDNGSGVAVPYFANSNGAFELGGSASGFTLNTTTGSTATGYILFPASAFILMWGSNVAAGTGAGTKSVTFPTITGLGSPGFPTACLNVQVSLQSPNPNVQIGVRILQGSTSQTGFSAYKDGTSEGFNWYAVGF
jgi:hypothetical protein